MHTKLTQFSIECTAIQLLGRGGGGKHFQYDVCKGAITCACRARRVVDRFPHDRHRSRSGLFHRLPSRTPDSSSSRVESLSSFPFHSVLFARFGLPALCPAVDSMPTLAKPCRDRLTARLEGNHFDLCLNSVTPVTLLCFFGSATGNIYKDDVPASTVHRWHTSLAPLPPLGPLQSPVLPTRMLIRLFCVKQLVPKLASSSASRRTASHATFTW